MIRDRIKELRRVKASELKPSPRNWRTHPESQRTALEAVLAEVGYADALLARELPDGTLELVDGHLRAGLDPEQEVPVLVLDVTEAEAGVILATLDPLAGMAEADEQKLGELLAGIEAESEGLGDLIRELAEAEGLDLFEPGAEDETESTTLTERFGAPPFSVLDARQGYWQDRKRAWLALGIQSELGRGGGRDHRRSKVAT